MVGADVRQTGHVRAGLYLVFGRFKRVLDALELVDTLAEQHRNEGYWFTRLHIPRKMHELGIGHGDDDDNWFSVDDGT